MSTIAMTFRASVEFDRARPPLKGTDPATLSSVMHVLSNEDSARLTGDLLRYCALNRRGLEVHHVEGFRDHAEWMARWYVESDANPHEWSITLPVTLLFDRGEPMYGGLVVRFVSARGRTPAYTGMSIHT